MSSSARPPPLSTIPSDRTEYDESPKSGEVIPLPIVGSFGDRGNAEAGPSSGVRRGSAR
jgi:hypothetical protein